MNWKDLKVRTKIIICFVIPLILMGVIGLKTYQSSNTVFEDVTFLKEESIYFAGIGQQMSRDVIQIQQWLTDISATRGLNGLNDGFDEAEKSYISFMKGLDLFKKMFESENDEEWIKKTNELSVYVKNYYEVGKEMAKGYVDGGPEVGNKLMAGFDEAAEKLNTTLEPYIDSQIKEMDEKVEAIISSVNSLKKTTLIILFISIIIIVIAGTFLSISITKPLFEVKGLSISLSEGDLTKGIDLNRRDEIGELGDAMRMMTENLRRIVDEIQTASQNVAFGSEELSASAQSLSQGATEQASSAEEITELAKNSLGVAEKAVEMLNVLVPDIGKTADLVAEITASSTEQNQGSGQIVKSINELDKVVQQNAGSSEEMASTAEELSSQAQQLQSSISFFKIGNDGGHKAHLIKHQPSQPEKRPDARPAPTHIKAKSIASKTGGMKLDMGSGGDSEDGDFERF